MGSKPSGGGLGFPESDISFSKDRFELIDALLEGLKRLFDFRADDSNRFRDRCRELKQEIFGSTIILAAYVW